MPEEATIRRAQQKKRKGDAPSTQAGEFVREEIHHIREGKHGARSTKQAIAIGLSKARKAGVNLKAPRKGQTSEKTRRSAQRALEQGRRKRSRTPSPARSRASSRTLKQAGRNAASRRALSRQAKGRTGQPSARKDNQ